MIRDIEIVEEENDEIAKGEKESFEFIDVIPFEKAGQKHDNYIILHFQLSDVGYQ